VAEVPSAGEHHREAVFIRGLDDFGISYRPPRLNHRRRACRGNGIEAVAKREKRI
jgi:hypothetical protein